MAKANYDLPCYDKFYQDLIPLLQGPNIRTVDMNWLESHARSFGNKTRYGSYVWTSKVSSRLAEKTVYLGKEQVRLPKPSDDQVNLVNNAPRQLEKILHWVKTLPFVHIRRQMGYNNRFNPVCDFYVSTSDPKNVRLAYMWGSTLFDHGNRPGPPLIMLHIPEEHTMRMQILSLPEQRFNIAMGTDYLGEDKKGFLRQSMWSADEEGMLGLHAGTKIVTVRDTLDNKLKRYGVFMFGMTATGKSTWSCHQLSLDHNRGEKTEVYQDDIVFLCQDGSALGSENNFYVKTDVVPDQQEAMYHALTDKTALLENVMLSASGEIDFLDESLCGNGRAVVFRDKLKVKRDGKLIGISTNSIDLPTLDEMDGLIFAFITRRNTIMSFAQELTPEQGVLSYLWGETTHSYASSPEKAGESVRVVGTDPFIIGSRGHKVNKFYEIVNSLMEKYPEKIRFLMYNTGGIGEIIETQEEAGVKKKKLVRKTNRVPIALMAAIQRGDLRRTNMYETGILGTRSIIKVEGKDLSDYDLKKFYSQEQIDRYVKDLVEGRKKHTESVADEGLRSEIIRAAERSYQIDRTSKKIYQIPYAGKTEKEPVVLVKSDEPVNRPRRPGVWRWR
jgi:phosphoenolpyruvate carboxykinase (ATP)